MRWNPTSFTYVRAVVMVVAAKIVVLPASGQVLTPVTAGRAVMDSMTPVPLTAVPDDGLPELTIYEALHTPFGDLSLQVPLQKRYIGSTWPSWPGGAPGPFFSAAVENISTDWIPLPAGSKSVDLFVDVNPASFFSATVEFRASTNDWISLLLTSQPAATGIYVGAYANGDATLNAFRIIHTGPREFGFAGLRLGVIPGPGALATFAVAAVWASRRRRG